ncbi:MAG: hypothetical protein E3J71_04835 [Candidatus Stahlbacteria bacterium]|nr:MAG: hypothetical protein E3J71_04835 [Candidatus Stahlbacteria bacterium]
MPDTRPYTRQEIVDGFNPQAELSRADSFDLQRFGFLPGVSAARWAPALALSADDASFELGGVLRTSYRLPDTLRAGPDIRFEGSIGPASFFATHRLTYAYNWPDTVFDAKSWRGDERPVFAEIPDARLDFDFNWLHLQAGRSQLHLGPVPAGGLFLSTEPWGLDHAAYSLKWKGVRFTSLFAWLQSDKRMVVHRFEYVAPRWKLGFSEAVVSSDTNDILPYLFAPAAFYYFMQWNKRQDENILWGVDASVLFPPVRFYTELLVDDFAYEPATGPNKIGGTIGGEWVSILSSEVDLRADYTAISKWTYAQRGSAQNYTFRGCILGDDLGPDADRSRLTVSWRIIPRISIEGLFFYERHGEGDVWHDFADDGAHDRETYHPPFPSGIVEHHLGIEGEVKLRLVGRSFLSFIARAEQISNLDHQEGSEEFRAVIQTDLYWEF